MPNYTYKCPLCGEFIINQGMNDKTIEICKKCGSTLGRVYKTINVGLNFKGSYNNTRK